MPLCPATGRARGKIAHALRLLMAMSWPNSTHLAGGGDGLPHEHLDQRGLPGAVRPEHRRSQAPVPHFPLNPVGCNTARKPRDELRAQMHTKVL